MLRAFPRDGGEHVADPRKDVAARGRKNAVGSTKLVNSRAAIEVNLRDVMIVLLKLMCHISYSICDTL